MCAYNTTAEYCTQYNHRNDPSIHPIALTNVRSLVPQTVLSSHSMNGTLKLLARKQQQQQQQQQQPLFRYTDGLI